MLNSSAFPARQLQKIGYSRTMQDTLPSSKMISA
jgi:hypothetical protein